MDPSSDSKDDSSEDFDEDSKDNYDDNEANDFDPKENNEDDDDYELTDFEPDDSDDVEEEDDFENFDPDEVEEDSENEEFDLDTQEDDSDGDDFDPEDVLERFELNEFDPDDIDQDNASNENKGENENNANEAESSNYSGEGTISAVIEDSDYENDQTEENNNEVEDNNEAEDKNDNENEFDANDFEDPLPPPDADYEDLMTWIHNAVYDQEQSDDNEKNQDEQKDNDKESNTDDNTSDQDLNRKFDVYDFEEEFNEPDSEYDDIKDEPLETAQDSEQEINKENDLISKQELNQDTEQKTLQESENKDENEKRDNLDKKKEKTKSDNSKSRRKKIKKLEPITSKSELEKAEKDHYEYGHTLKTRFSPDTAQDSKTTSRKDKTNKKKSEEKSKKEKIKKLDPVTSKAELEKAEKEDFEYKHRLKQDQIKKRDYKKDKALRIEKYNETKKIEESKPNLKPKTETTQDNRSIIKRKPKPKEKVTEKEHDLQKERVTEKSSKNKTEEEKQNKSKNEKDKKVKTISKKAKLKSKTLAELYRKTGKRPFYQGRETKGFILWKEEQKKIISKKKEKEKSEGKSAQKEEITEDWVRLLINWIYRAKEYHETDKKELIKKLKQFQWLIKRIYFLIQKREQNIINKKELQELFRLVDRLESLNTLYKDLFINFHSFSQFYNSNYLWDMWKIEAHEQKFTRFLIQKLNFIKNNKRTNEIVSKNQNSKINWKDLIKKNINTILNLTLNEKSEVINLIQKDNLSEEEQKKLINFLSKLTKKELIQFFGEKFEEHSNKYIQWGKGWYNDIGLNKIILENYFRNQVMEKKTSNRAVLEEILNQENLTLRNFMNNLKKNIYKISMRLSEKSKINKIIQKDNFNENDKEKLITLLKKPPSKELISLSCENLKQINENVFDISALRKRKFIHNNIKYIFRWANQRHDSSFQSNKLEKYLSSVYKNENLDLFNNNNNIILNNCSNFRVKYLKKLSTIEISKTLKKRKLILEFDEFNDNLCIFRFLKNFIIIAKKVETKIEKKIIELKSKYRNEPEKLKKREMELRKRRHDYVEKYLIKKNRFVIATEIPIYDELLYILGHIDILLLYKNKDSIYIGVVDYKPEVENGKSYDFIKTLPQICMYALLLKKKLGFKNIRLFCVSFNNEKGWIYKPDLILKLPEIIKDYYDERYFNGKLLDIFGNPRDYDLFNWTILSRIYALHNPISDFFSAVRIEITKILNLNINSSLDAIALKLIELKNKLEQDSIFFNKKQKSFLEEFRNSIRYLTDKSINKEIVFSKFFSHFKFNLNIWRYNLTKKNRLILEILNEIDKLRILFGREKINRVNYDYYILSILYNLRDAIYSDICFLLAKYYNFYSFNNTYLSTLLDSLINKDLIRKLDTGNYVLTSNTKTNLKLLGVKKDPMVFYSRNKYLLKNRYFALKFLIHLKKYGSYQTLTASIFKEIRKKIRDVNNIIISTRNLKNNIRFLFKNNFLNKHGQISSVTNKILEDLRDKNLSESNIKNIKYGKYILQAIYSLVYPRFTYIDYHLKNLRKIPEENTYFRFYLDTSINLLLLNNYIKKHGAIYLLSDKGKEYITRNNIRKHKKLQLYGNLKEFENYCQFGYQILAILKSCGKLSKKQISIKIPTESITRTLNFSTLRRNLEKLKKMNYIYKTSSNEYDLTIEGEELFNITEFIKNLRKIEVYNEIIPTLEQIKEIPDIFNILQIIFSMKKAPRSYIDYFCIEKSISHHSVSQALDVLCRGKILEIKKRFYILTEKGLDFISDNDIEIEEDIHIRSLVKYFNDYLSNAFVILKHILKYGSISFKDLKQLTKISQTTLDRNLKSLKSMNFINRKRAINSIYTYFITSEGRRIYNNPKIKKLLNEIEKNRE